MLYVCLIAGIFDGRPADYVFMLFFNWLCLVVSFLHLLLFLLLENNIFARREGMCVGAWFVFAWTMLYINYYGKCPKISNTLVHYFFMPLPAFGRSGTYSAYVTFVTRFKFTCMFRCKFTSAFLLPLITFIPSGLESWNVVWHLPASRPFNVW